NPTGAWVTQQARNLSFTRLFERTRLPIHDRDSKFSAGFDEVFRSEGIKVIRTPVPAPRATAYAEGFVRTVRAECLDAIDPWRGHLERVLRRYVTHGIHPRIPSRIVNTVLNPLALAMAARAHEALQAVSAPTDGLRARAVPG